MTGLRERWSAGETAFGGWCTTGSSFSAELIGTTGFDYVCVDLQHGLSDFEQGWMLVQAMRGTGATPVVRVPFNSTPWPGKALDAGAEAVIVPMVNSRADAELAAAGAGIRRSACGASGRCAPACCSATTRPRSTQRSASS